jgi:tape measure domain-containing protein
MAEEVKIIIGTEADSKGVNQASKDIENVGNEVEKAGEKAKKASFDFSEFAKNAGIGATGILAAIGGFVGFGAKVAGDLEAARQGFVGLLGSAEKADEAMARVRKEAGATPFDIPGLTDNAVAMTAITKDGNKAIDMLLNVGKAIAFSGGGQNELNSVIRNLRQVSSTGKMTEMDLRQFQSAIPVFDDVIIKAGMTVEQIKNASNAGELLGLAFQAAGEKGGMTAEAFDNIAGSYKVVTSNLRDEVTTFSADVVTQSGLFDVIKQNIVGLTNFIKILKPEIVDFMKALAGNPDALIIVATIIGVLMVGAVIGLMVALWPIIAATLILIAVGALLGILFTKIGAVVFWLTEIIRQHWVMFLGLITFILVLATPAILTYIATLVLMAVQAIWAFGIMMVNGLIAFGAILLGMWPIILIAALVAGAVMLLATAWKNNWLGMRDILKPIVDNILAFLKPVIDFINKIIEGIKKLSGIKGSGVSASGLSGVGEVSGGTGGLSSIPDILKSPMFNLSNISQNMSLGGLSTPNIPGMSVPGMATMPQMQTVSTQQFTQNNVINTPVDLEAMMRDLQFAAKTG